MNKRILSTAIALTLLLAVAPNQAFAKKPISIVVGGEKLETDVAPVIVDGRTLVPLRAIFEALNAEVNWDDANKIVTATKDDTVISLKIGSNELKVNSDVKTLDVPAQIVDGRTMIPVRAVSEALDCKVSWNGKTETVRIKTDVWVLSKLEYCSVWSGGVPSYQWEEYTYSEDGSVVMDVYSNDQMSASENKDYHWKEVKEYDVDGNLTKVISYDYEGAQTVEEYVYNDRGLLVKSGETEYTYDNEDNLVCEKRGDAKVINYTYDSKNRLIKSEDVYTDAANDVSYSNIIEYEYDSKGNKIKEINKGINVVKGQSATSEYSRTFEYDWSGKLIKEKNSDGHYINYEYDENGELAFEMSSYGTIEYDKWGDTKVVYSWGEDESDKEYVNIYNDYLCRSDYSYNNEEASYSLDDEGRLVFFSDGNVDAEIEYDEYGNVISYECSDGSYATYEYVKIKR